MSRRSSFVLGALVAGTAGAFVLTGASCDSSDPGPGGTDAGGSGDAGGSAAGDGGIVSGGTPQAKCEALARAICVRELECGPPASNTAANLQLCTRETSSVCPRVDAVANTYDSCIQDLRALSCVALQRSLPASCEGVIQIPPAPLTPEEQMCLDLAGSLCKRAVECVPPTRGTAMQAESGCLERLIVDGGFCDDVVSIPPTFGACHQAVRMTACSALFPMQRFSPPAACSDVFGSGGAGGASGAGGRGGAGGAGGAGAAGGAGGRGGSGAGGVGGSASGGSTGSTTGVADAWSGN
jgi:hypothetical protein